jgi:hypothetical protein
VDPHQLFIRTGTLQCINFRKDGRFISDDLIFLVYPWEKDEEIICHSCISSDFYLDFDEESVANSALRLSYLPEVHN